MTQIVNRRITSKWYRPVLSSYLSITGLCRAMKIRNAIGKNNICLKVKVSHGKYCDVRIDPWIILKTVGILLGKYTMER